MAARIAAHRARRDRVWATVEAGRPGRRRCDADGDRCWSTRSAPGSPAADDFAVDVDGARRRAAATRTGDTVVVSEEVGLGVHPATEVGRRFRDALGDVNRRWPTWPTRCCWSWPAAVLPLERP